MRSSILFLWALVTLWAPNVVQASERYSVIGLGSQDTINIREDVWRHPTSVDAPVIGKISGSVDSVDGTGVSIEFEGSRWREVTYKGTTGWVPDDFLDLSDLPTDPHPLACGGTEPFWHLETRDNSVTYETADADQAVWRILETWRGENRVNLWSFEMSTDQGRSVTALIVHSDQCSDGMSDFIYAFEVYLVGARAGAGPLQGCCSYR